MAPKFGILVAVVVLASAIAIPVSDADGDVFSYKAQLDDCGKTIYDAVNKLAVDEPAKNILVDFGSDNISVSLFVDESSAKKYADSTVQNALAALYYSNPMMAYLWNYPIKAVEVTSETTIVKMIDGEKENNYYKVKSVSFELSLPKGIDKTSIDAVNKAVSEISISGSKNYEKVQSIMRYLDGLTFEKDTDEKVSNIYDALVTKKTSSAGIAAAFTRLCSDNGIMSIILSGTNGMAQDEKKSFWNYVYLDDAWYIVDAAYCVNGGIAGHTTYITANNEVYSLTSEHKTDLKLSSTNTLNVPVLNEKAFDTNPNPSFIDKYGSIIVLVAMVLVVIATLVYAAKKGLV